MAAPHPLPVMGQRGNAVEPNRLVEDEFTCPGAVRGLLLTLGSTLQRVFGVTIAVDGDIQSVAQWNGQIWLKMRGQRGDVDAAKIFVKGVVNQETEQEISYPEDLHCVFCGAWGLFMDCLIRTTSANLTVVSPGSLNISGLTEPVVQAYSLILNLVDKYQGTKGQSSEVASESVDIRRAFKNLVQQYNDRHTLNLLVLPGAVKEILVSLVKESKLDMEKGRPNAHEDPKGCTMYVPTSGAIQKVPAEVSQRRAEVEHAPVEVEEEEGVVHLVGNQEEWRLQLNFLTAMGYSEDVVKQVLAKTGADMELSQILDLVQQEQDQKTGEGDENPTRGEEANRIVREESGVEGEDFVLGVLKNAAASCGYSEEKVMEVYSNLPGLSTTELLQELHKEMERGRHGGPQEKDRKLQQEGRWTEHKKRKTRVERDQSPDLRPIAVDPDDRLYPFLPNSPCPVRGPPERTYPPGPYAAVFEQEHIPAALLPRQRHEKSMGMAVSTMVTGEQRFLDGLSKPFHLKLTDEPGDAGLRQVTIDGSNIAMSHGLGQFFSCRGIALAVQYFWNRGHRNIAIFVPQWRLKRDPKIKEQHFLTELQNLGLLSVTPSREVQGKRINSYDDRFMLQLAQKTDGVIVTNDNLRDLLDESPAWRDIIKKRLLQYTFVGDLFMVPDDPLGRGGPHLKNFLRSQHRSPVPGSHSFAGVASRIPPPVFPHAQTEVLQYRDRMPFREFSKGQEGQKVQGQRDRSSAETATLRETLFQVFPGQDRAVTMALSCNPALTDIHYLSQVILELMDEAERS